MKLSLNHIYNSTQSYCSVEIKFTMKLIYKEFFLLTILFILLSCIFLFNDFGDKAFKNEAKPLNDKVLRVPQSNKTEAKNKNSPKSGKNIDVRQTVVIEPKSLEPGRQYRIIFLVLTAITHFEFRNFVRNTWAKRDRLDKANATVIFVIGKAERDKVEDMAKKESDTYGDILQTGGVDNYRDLVYKSMTWIQWLNKKGVPTDVAMKLDDDMIPHIDHILQFIHNRSLIEDLRKTRMFYCWEFFTSIIRQPNSPWYVPEDVYKGENGFFPPFCSGIAHMMSHAAVRAIADSLDNLTIPVVPVEDAFITGIVAKPLNISRIDIFPKMALGMQRIETKSDHKDILVFGIENRYDKDIKTKLKMWEKIEKIK